MALSVLIIEDEYIIALDLKKALKNYGYEIFGHTRNYAQTIELLKDKRPDFALVDIMLQGEQQGIELGKILVENFNIPFLYITSHADKGTLEKVKLTKPIGYILKPFKREALYASIEVALLNLEKQNKNELDFLVVKKGDEKIRINFNEILFIESDGNYSNIQTINAKFTERKTSKELFENHFNHPFIRVHKSYLVNKSKIRQYTRDKLFIGEHEIAVGRAYSENLKTNN